MYHISRLITFSFLVFTCLATVIPDKAIAQETYESSVDILDLANSIYRADDRLLNGKYYKPRHFFAEGHPYFNKNEWVDGTLFIKGILYNRIPIKYNIEDDKIIIKSILKNRISKDILLHNSFVDSLIIGSHIFHNTNNFSLDNTIGIAELIYRGNISAYFKHSSEFKDELSERQQHGKYLNARKRLFLFDKDSFISIQTKKDLLAYFEEHKKEVKQFLRKNRISIKKASNRQIVKLIQFCEHL